MKSKLRSSLVLLTVAASTATICLFAKDAPAKKPALQVDNSPVADTKAPVVSSYANIVEPVQKAVVSVYSTKIVRQQVPMNPFFRQFFGDQGMAPERQSKEQGVGSGVIVSKDGYILTNNHVIEGADELNVSLPDDREFKAKVIGSDPKTDVAVIKIEAENLPTVTLADSDKLRVGDVVFAVGNPLGIGQTVTMGIVSATGRNNLGLLDSGQGYENFIQTDAAINMGNSGGALVDAKGRLVGINTAIISTTRGNIGIGFAIPVNLAASIMHSLIEHGTVTRGYLGVNVELLTPEMAETLGVKKDQRGVVITNIPKGGPAEKSDLKRSDVIIAINGKTVTTPQDLRLTIAQLAPDTEVEVRVLRDGKERNVKVKLGTLPGAPGREDELLEGVSVTRLSDETRRQLNVDDRFDGLVITNVNQDSEYADRLVPNMIILEINRAPVTDLEAARQAIKPGRNLLLVYMRGVYRYITLSVN